MDTLYITLSRHLGTLTLGWVLSLSDIELTPDALTPGFYGGHRFGV